MHKKSGSFTVVSKSCFEARLKVNTFPALNMVPLKVRLCTVSVDGLPLILQRVLNGSGTQERQRKYIYIYKQYASATDLLKTC